jgi:hypothetical protein
MRLNEFRQIIQEFARQARRGEISTSSSEGTELAALAEQLDTRLGRAISTRTYKSEEVSFAPAKCPCCGK